MHIGLYIEYLYLMGLIKNVEFYAVNLNRIETQVNIHIIVPVACVHRGFLEWVN